MRADLLGDEFPRKTSLFGAFVLSCADIRLEYIIPSDAAGRLSFSTKSAVESAASSVTRSSAILVVLFRWGKFEFFHDKKTVNIPEVT